MSSRAVSKIWRPVRGARGDGEPATERRQCDAGDGASAAWRGKPVTVRPAAQRPARMGVGYRATNDAVTVSVFTFNGLNDFIGDGDGVFVWKESIMGHCYFIFL